MKRTRRDPRTPDLFDYAGDKDPIPRFEEKVSAIASLTHRICRGMKEAAERSKQNGVSRTMLAKSMSEYLGEEVTPAMLDKYISAGSGDHQISVVRFLAFVHATGDKRLLNLLVEPFGDISVPRECEGWIVAGQLAMAEDQIKLKLDDTRHRRNLMTRFAMRGGR